MDVRANSASAHSEALGKRIEGVTPIIKQCLYEFDSPHLSSSTLHSKKVSKDHSIISPAAFAAAEMMEPDIYIRLQHDSSAGERSGHADIFPCLGCQPQALPVPHRVHPAQTLLRSCLVIVPEIGIEHLHELVEAYAASVPPIEELVLEPSGESPHRGVVGGLPLVDMLLTRLFLSQMAIHPGHL